MSGLYPGYGSYHPTPASAQANPGGPGAFHVAPGHHPQGSLASLISPTPVDAPQHPMSGSPEAGPSSLSNANGKRQLGASDDAEFKRPRTEHESEDDGHEGAYGEDTNAKSGKIKSSRGSRACMVCRRLKMKCIGAENGPPCKRCAQGKHECIFEESNRGKRSTKKQEMLALSIRKMEKTLDAVVRSIGTGNLPEDLVVSRSPSPTHQTSFHSNAGSPPDYTQHSVSSHTVHRSGPSPLASASHLSQSHHRSSASHTSGVAHSPSSPKLHSLPDNELNPLGLLAEASLANSRQAVQSPQSTRPGVTPVQSQQNVGVASDLYFKPGPMTILPLRRVIIERALQPEMLQFTSTDEVMALFNIFFSHMNMHACILDPLFHTPALVCSRSPFLLTAICMVASKYYDARPELYPKLTEIVRKQAFDVPAQGYKSVEIVQAYLVLSLWGCGPAERYEMDKTWMLLGMGIRVATDLNLHRKIAVIGPETADDQTRDREIRNRERTWIMAFILDHSLAVQLGKPYTIQEDTIIRTVTEWPHHEQAIAGDEPMTQYAELQRLMSRFLDILGSTNGTSMMQSDMDYLAVIRTMESQLLNWHQGATSALGPHYERWQRVAGLDSAERFQYVVVVEKFYFNYCSLVINSFGLQNAMDRAPVNLSHFFTRCHTHATKCALLVRDELSPRGYMRYSPDSHFVLCSYAVLSLLKLVRPEFHASAEQQSATFRLVADVADTFERIAVSPSHTPALYSTFLRALLANKMNPPDTAPAAQPGSSAGVPTMTMQPGDGDAAQAQAQAQYGDGMAYGGYAAAYPDYHFAGELGPGLDASTFPPTMGALPMPMPLAEDMLAGGALSFWDNVLVPGWANPMEGLSGGFVYGIGGSGLITPGLGVSPAPSGLNTPSLASMAHPAPAKMNDAQ